jgi:hypothetical protein
MRAMEDSNIPTILDGGVIDTLSSAMLSTRDKEGDSRPSEMPSVSTTAAGSVVGTDDNGSHQKDDFSNRTTELNIQLLENHYQRFVRGWQTDLEAQDGDESSSRSSSSGQGPPSTESVAAVRSACHTPTKKAKRPADSTPGGNAGDSEDDGEPNKKRCSRRQPKTADEKQMELRCTELAAGRQTTARCLTFSAKDLHRLKSVSLPF